MATWAEFVTAAPDFAARVRSIFASGTNKTIATVRADGSPRISGTELEIDDDRASLGMMAGSRKLGDVLRDPRVAIHSPTIEPPAIPTDWIGDAKLSGRLVALTPPVDAQVADAAYFELDIDAAVLTRLNEEGTLLRIESWGAGRGYRVVERE